MMRLGSFVEIRGVVFDANCVTGITPDGPEACRVYVRRACGGGGGFIGGGPFSEEPVPVEEGSLNVWAEIQRVLSGSEGYPSKYDIEVCLEKAVEADYKLTKKMLLLATKLASKISDSGAE